MQKLQVGTTAPDFLLNDAYEKPHRLSDYLKQWIILYFYPKDNTPGCTIEACQFRDEHSVYTELNTVILGVSLDDCTSHRNFSDLKALPFTLLADTTGDVCKTYGTWLKIGPIKYCKRHSFIINPQGKIVKIYRSVSPKKHAQQILNELSKLQA